MFAVKILLTFYDSPLADSQTQVIFLRDNNNNKAFIIKLSIASCYKVLFLIMCRFCQLCEGDIVFTLFVCLSVSVLFGLMVCLCICDGRLISTSFRTDIFLRIKHKNKIERNNKKVTLKYIYQSYPYYGRQFNLRFGLRAGGVSAAPAAVVSVAPAPAGVFQLPSHRQTPQTTVRECCKRHKRTYRFPTRTQTTLRNVRVKKRTAAG